MLPFRRDPLLALFRLSLAFAGIIFAHALLIGRAPKEIVADIWELVFLCPALTFGFRLQAGIAYAMTAKAPPRPRGEDAERSARLVAQVARRFVIGMSLGPVFIQAVWISGIFGIPQALELDPDGVVRVVFLMIGAPIAYLGNVIPKIPPPACAGDVAGQRLAVRLIGWVFAVHGLLICLGALVLPVDDMAVAWPAAAASMLVCSVLAAAAPHLLKLVKGR